MSETSEYIMGQVRSMVIINRNTAQAYSKGDLAQVGALLQQQEQELKFLQSMLRRHPPHRLEHMINE
jgi:hypothetical protein